MPPEQIENYVMKTDKLNNQYHECIAESIQKVELIIFKATRQYNDFSFFFANRFNISNINHDQLELFNQKLDSLISFMDVIS